MPEKKVTHETVRWNTDSLDNYEQAIIQAINTSEKDDLPFTLPPEVKWPSKSRQKNDRAMLIMRAGFAALQKKYSISQEEDDSPKERQENEISEGGWA